MTKWTSSEGAIRELDQRSSDGVSVTLFWNTKTDRVFVSVMDDRHGEPLEFEVASADALDAFHHPYAYLQYARPDRALAA